MTITRFSFWPQYVVHSYGSRALLADILKEVAAAHGFTVEELRGPSRRGDFVRARQEFMFRARRETDKSTPFIGRYINRDHSTVLHGVQSYIARHGLNEHREAA